MSGARPLSDRAVVERIVRLLQAEQALEYAEGARSDGARGGI